MANFGDVIVVIPGILGSRLEHKDGSIVYDLTVASLPKTLWTLSGASLPHLNGDAPPDDGVVATDLFNYQWLPGFFGNDDYAPLLKMLRESVSDSDKQVIKFPYDWRASNRWAGERLNCVARNALKSWQDSSGNDNAKLWLVCHSMGGLVARYFCEHLGGAEITRELITIGTPHRGAVKALEVLVNGMRLAGLIDVSQFVRSLPSVYELLPQYPVLRDPGGASGSAFRLADAYGLGDRLGMPQRSRPFEAACAVPNHFTRWPSLDPGMLERAVGFHEAIRNPVVKRMDEGAPAPYALRCLLNRRQPTLLSALLKHDSVEASTVDPLTALDATSDLFNRGDGTVAAFSAIPIEWDDTSAAIAVSAKHVGMPSSATVIDVLRNWIRPQEARSYMGTRVEESDVLGLLAPSAIKQGERLVIEVDALKAANVVVSLTPIEGNMPAVTERFTVQSRGLPQSFELGRPAAGSWRVTVMPENRRRPIVSDYVVVLGSG